jgi:hypothetical protein
MFVLKRCILLKLLFFVTYKVKICIIDHYSILGIILSHTGGHKVVPSSMFECNSIHSMFKVDHKVVTSSMFKHNFIHSIFNQIIQLNF